MSDATARRPLPVKGDLNLTCVSSLFMCFAIAVATVAQRSSRQAEAVR